MIIIALIAISILIIKAKSPKYEEKIADDPIIIEEEPEIEETPVEEEAEPETPVIQEQPKVEETPVEEPKQSTNSQVNLQTNLQTESNKTEETTVKTEDSSPKNEVQSTISQETIKETKEPEPIIVEEPMETVTEEPIDETVDETEEASDETIVEATEALYTASQFKRLGVIKWNGWRWTWYSERVLPGGGLTIPGRHNDENGYICDENDYICVASSVLSKGTVVDTPFGKQGKVYDCGCDADVLDVYVGW